MIRHDVVCTAGHVDHGKSALVRALTGMEPDRLAEERRRGLTIELGYAWARLGGRRIAFVDVPGHERFVATMLAGAGPVRTALLVVAADEGWKPQSQEHLDVLALLDVDSGVVALSRCDLADAQRREATAAEVRDRLAGTPLAGAPLVATSAVTGEGLEELADRLAATLAARPPAADLGRARLWVDRAFVIRGAGTVVTGTLGDGALRVGGEVEVQPGGRRSRVRGIQCLGAAVEEAAPGSRVAVNLADLEVADVPRGAAVTAPGRWRATTAFEAWCRVLPDREVGVRGAWRLHVGAARVGARVRPLVSGPLTGEGPVTVELDEPLPLAAGDRFVLRESGRAATVAGGVVVDPDPAARPRGGRARQTRAAQVAARRARLDDPLARLDDHVAAHGVVESAVARQVMGVPAEARPAVAVPLGRHLAAADAVADWTAAAVAAVTADLEAHPTREGSAVAVAVAAATAAGCARGRHRCPGAAGGAAATPRSPAAADGGAGTGATGPAGRARRGGRDPTAAGGGGDPPRRRPRARPPPGPGW